MLASYDLFQSSFYIPVSPAGHFYHPDIISKYLDITNFDFEKLREIERCFLGRFLRYTEQLELNVVNPVFENILGSVGHIAAKNRIEESRVKNFIQEENVHAEIAHEIRCFYINRDIVFLNQASPAEHLTSLVKKYSSAVFSQRDIEFIFVFASETLISSRLALNTTKNIVRDVADYMRMHLCEEAQHRSYFLSKFSEVYKLWPKEKQALAPEVLANCIYTFLSQDLTALKLDMIGLGINPSLLKVNIKEDIVRQADLTFASMRSILSTDDIDLMKRILKTLSSE